MLADPRAEALSTRFAAQWLRLNDVDTMLPDALLVSVLRPHARRGRSSARPSCSSTSIVRDDRSVLDLLTADYTYVNERIARHYGIPNVTGTEFRRVDAARRPARPARPGQHAGADLGRRPHVAGDARQVDHGSAARVAAAAAAAERAGARGDEGDAAGGKLLSVRERMEEHRKNPACASCHRVIDPLGLALENFDVDRQVAHQGQRACRSTRSACMYDGTQLDGPAGLRNALLKHQDVVPADLHREPDDVRARPARRVLRHADGARDRARRRARTTIASRRSCSGIVNSAAFQMSRSTRDDRAHDRPRRRSER